MKQNALGLLMLAVAMPVLVQAALPVFAEPPVSKPTESKPAQSKPDDRTLSMDAQSRTDEVLKPDQLLARFEGKWYTQMAVYTPDGVATRVYKGTSQNRLTMEKRYLRSEHTGRLEGEPFQGSGMVGYNPYQQQYESTWVDSTATSMVRMSGSFEPSGNVLRLSGECRLPDGGVTTLREVVTWVSKDLYTSEFFDADGSKSMQITYCKNENYQLPDLQVASGQEREPRGSSGHEYLKQRERVPGGIASRGEVSLGKRTGGWRKSITIVYRSPQHTQPAQPHKN